MLPRIIVHGGAWDWDDALDAEKRAGVSDAAAIGHTILKDGGCALDAVEQAVVALENNPILDAGTGGYLNQDGVVQLDALIVDGAKRDFGAVGAVTQVRNPITVARKIMEETEHCFFVGAGADQMAQKLGIPATSNEQLITPAMRDYYRAQRNDGSADTVGAVAIDSNGHTAAATSTSGTSYKPAGRVGDSPLYGSGGYAQDGIGAAGATGLGENIMRSLLCKHCCDMLAEGLIASDAAQETMRYIEARFQNSMSGIIVIDRHGNLGVAHTTSKIVFGWADDAGNIHSATHSKELSMVSEP